LLLIFASDFVVANLQIRTFDFAFAFTIAQKRNKNPSFVQHSFLECGSQLPLFIRPENQNTAIKLSYIPRSITR